MKSTEFKHILIADDDLSIRTSLRAILEAVGYQVTAATDGRVAIEVVLNEDFDLVILDLAMPKIDGLEALKEMRFVCGPDAMPPVLILTAYGSVTAAMESANHGAVEFLHKPILPELLRSSVRQAIAGSIHPRLFNHDNIQGTT